MNIDPDLKLCPICFKLGLRAKVGTQEIDIDGELVNIEMHYSVCEHCECEVTDCDQMGLNKKIMLTAKNEHSKKQSGSEVCQEVQ